MSKCIQCDGRGWYYVPAREAVTREVIRPEAAAKPLIPMSYKLQCPVCHGSGSNSEVGR